MNTAFLKTRVSVLILFIWLVAGCGYYSFKGSLPSHLKTVAVPLFYSQSQEPGIAEEITNEVINQFIEDNTLKIADESEADLVLTGTVLAIPPARPAIVKEGENVAEMRLTVSVKVKCEDVRMSKVLFNKTFRNEISLNSDAGLEERQLAIKEALQVIAEDIVNATISGW